eukprot:646535-Amphidinium_carterae.1
MAGARVVIGRALPAVLQLYSGCQLPHRQPHDSATPHVFLHIDPAGNDTPVERDIVCCARAKSKNQGARTTPGQGQINEASCCNYHLNQLLTRPC